MADEYGTPPEKISVIPCGVDEAQFAVEGDLDSYRTIFAEPDEQIVGYVGRLDKEKGLPNLVAAFARVLVAAPNAKLVLVGKGVLQESIQRQARELRIGPRVKFAGYLTGNALAGFYRCCDLLVVPSLYEPFGMVALEGMINRTPVVASDAGGLAEIVEHEKTGLSFPADDEGALAQQLLRLLHDRELAQRLAQDAYQYASTQYDWRAIAAQTVAVYQASIPAVAAAGST